MSVHSLKPTFRDRQGYMAWRSTWRRVYARVTLQQRRKKVFLKSRQREGDASAIQREMRLASQDATKLMTLLSEAKLLRDRLIKTEREIAAMLDSFPVRLETRTADLHFNKAHFTNPTIPMWVVKAKGKSFYVHHIEAQIPWSTRELSSGSTLGMIRLRNCVIDIDRDAVATIRAA